MQDKIFPFTIENPSIVVKDLGLIEGYLEVLFIETDKPIALTIKIKGTDYIILEENNINGKYMLYPRVKTNENFNTRFNYDSTRHVLMDNIEVIIKAPKNTNCRLKFRIEEFK